MVPSGYTESQRSTTGVPLIQHLFKQRGTFGLGDLHEALTGEVADDRGVFRLGMRQCRSKNGFNHKLVSLVLPVTERLAVEFLSMLRVNYDDAPRLPRSPAFPHPIG